MQYPFSYITEFEMISLSLSLSISLSLGRVTFLAEMITKEFLETNFAM